MLVKEKGVCVCDLAFVSHQLYYKMLLFFYPVHFLSPVLCTLLPGMLLQSYLSVHCELVHYLLLLLNLINIGLFAFAFLLLLNLSNVYLVFSFTFCPCCVSLFNSFVFSLSRPATPIQVDTMQVFNALHTCLTTGKGMKCWRCCRRPLINAWCSQLVILPLQELVMSSSGMTFITRPAPLGDHQSETSISYHHFYKHMLFCKKQNKANKLNWTCMVLIICHCSCWEIPPAVVVFSCYSGQFEVPG